jgi:hypothetical protein
MIIETGELGPVLHWVATDCTMGTPENGNHLSKYIGPGPPKGNHRYIFILFQQNGSAPVTLPAKSEARRNWDFGAFLSNNPHLVPVALNFYYTDAN